MSDYLIGLAIDSALILFVAGFLVGRYRLKVALPQKLRALQYRLFALRDRAVRLVAEGVMREDDPRFQKWYDLINRSASSGAVSYMHNGLAFVLGLLRNSRAPTPEEVREIEELPPPMKQLIVDYGSTIIGICWDGSKMLRLLLRLATRFKSIKEWLKRQRPTEATRYAELRRFADHYAPGHLGASV